MTTKITGPAGTLRRYGWTQSRMAATLGVTRSRLSGLCQQKSVLWSTVERMAAALGIPPELLATPTLANEDKPGERKMGAWL